MPTLDWIGKKAVVNHHRQVPYRLLHCDKSLSAGDPEAGNLLVQGDNLEALKALLPYYAGKVKCIYIDPPYNTGNEGWVYNDNVNSPEIKRWLGETVGSEAEDLSRHDKWLCMMCPLLSLLREFLTQDGAIFVSIDDHEMHRARAIMGELFGEQNFVANVIWQKKYTRSNDASYFSDNHDFLICFAKSKADFTMGRLERTAAQDKAYKNPDNHRDGPWKATPLHAKSGEDRTEYTFKNGVRWTPPKGTFRRFSDETMKRFDENNEIWFGKKGDAIPARKTFLGSLDEGVVPVTLWLHEVAGDNHIGKDELKQFGIEMDFDSPKPTTLLDLVLQIGGDSNCLILDSFAGSGTTGHAALKLNKTYGGTRRFILVEMDEQIAQNITAIRLKKAVEGFTNTLGGEVAPLGGGFRFCKLGKPLFDSFGGIDPEVRFPDLAAHVFFTETGSPIPKRADGKTPLLGVHGGRTIYLLFNGVLGDKRPAGGNVLTKKVLESLPPHEGPRVVYGEACRLGESRLRDAGVIFRQVPWEVRVG